MNKLQKKAIAAKKDGYETVYTIVKQVFNTEYFNTNSIDKLIETGKWEAAPYHLGFDWHGPIGCKWNEIEGKKISKQDLYRKY